MENREYQWLRVLTLLEQTNNSIKSNDFFGEQRSEFYLLKDNILEYIIKNKEDKLQVTLYLIPYYKYSFTTKDKAGALMRKDNQKNPFEYYLSMVEPCSQDIEVPEKATIEIEINLDNRLFNFHIPQYKTTEWGVDISNLQRKDWISEKEFKRQQFQLAKAEINELMNILKG